MKEFLTFQEYRLLFDSHIPIWTCIVRTYTHSLYLALALLPSIYADNEYTRRMQLTQKAYLLISTSKSWQKLNKQPRWFEWKYCLIVFVAMIHLKMKWKRVMFDIKLISKYCSKYKRRECSAPTKQFFWWFSMKILLICVLQLVKFSFNEFYSFWKVNIGTCVLYL